MAIKGDGFFAVERANGTTEYTRNGAFDISIEGKSGYLVTSDGSYVLDASGKRIKLDRQTFRTKSASIFSRIPMDWNPIRAASVKRLFPGRLRS